MNSLLGHTNFVDIVSIKVKTIKRDRKSVPKLTLFYPDCSDNKTIIIVTCNIVISGQFENT